MYFPKEKTKGMPFNQKILTACRENVFWFLWPQVICLLKLKVQQPYPSQIVDPTFPNLRGEREHSTKPIEHNHHPSTPITQGNNQLDHHLASCLSHTQQWERERERSHSFTCAAAIHYSRKTRASIGAYIANSINHHLTQKKKNNRTPHMHASCIHATTQGNKGHARL